MFIVAISIGIILTLPNYIMQVVDKFQEKQELQEDLKDLKKDEKTLNREVAQLNDAEYIARIARQKYLFSKDGEMIIKVDSKDEKVITKSKASGFNFEINSQVISAVLLVVILLVSILRIRRNKRKTRQK